jgi:hypothetical protein
MRKAASAVAVSGKSCKESSMLMRKKRLWGIVFIAVLVVTGTMLGTATAQKASVPKPQNKLAMAEDDAFAVPHGF